MMNLRFYEIVVLFGGSEATACFLGLTSSSFLYKWTTAWYGGWCCQQRWCLLLKLLMMRLLFCSEWQTIIDLQRGKSWFLCQRRISLIILCLHCCNDCLSLGQVRPIIILHQHFGISLNRFLVAFVLSSFGLFYFVTQIKFNRLILKFWYISK